MSSDRILNLYTVTWCPHCQGLLNWLDQEGIPYFNHDVDESDVDWKVAMTLTKGVDMVPVAEVDGEVVWGTFSEDFKSRLKNLLE